MKPGWRRDAMRRSIPSSGWWRQNWKARWNVALRKAQTLEERLRDFNDAGNMPAIPDKEILLSLAQDLPAGVERAGHRCRAEAENRAQPGGGTGGGCGRGETGHCSPDSLGWRTTLGVAGEQAWHGATRIVDGHGSDRGDSADGQQI